MTASDERIHEGIQARLSRVESYIPRTPVWRAPMDPQLADGRMRPAGAVRVGARRGDALPGWLVPAVALLVLAVVILPALAQRPGGAGTPTGPAATTTPSPSPPPTPLRAAFEPRMTLVVTDRERWTLSANNTDILEFLYDSRAPQADSAPGFLLMAEPRGVFDPTVETLERPLPDDLAEWMRQHPYLDAQAPTDLDVGGLSARAVDATVTYEPQPSTGQTLQFVNIGPGSWNLEPRRRMRVVVLDLGGRPLLIAFVARPEAFDAGVEHFMELLRTVRFEEAGPTP